MISNQNKENLFNALVLVNLAAGFFGAVLFYASQFAHTNVFLWPFVPDCPLAAFLVGVSLLLAKQKKYYWICFIAVAAALKYGFWTVFVLSFYSDYYLPLNTLLPFAFLFFSHVALFLEAFLFSSRIGFKSWYIIPALFFLTLSDFSDYALATHPPMPESSLQLMFPLTILMSFAACLLAVAVVKSFKEPVIDLFEDKRRSRVP